MRLTQTDKPDEHRRAPRKKTLKGARIVFPNGISTIACQIRDQSDTGALIVVELASTIPDEFNLILDGEDRKRPCKVAWRRAGRIGVRYVEALTDRRHHVVSVPQQEAARPVPAPTEPDQKAHSRLLKKPIRF